MAFFDSYAEISLSANQTTNIAVGNHVEWSILEFAGTQVGPSNVSLSTGVGQQNGRITLSGMRFLVISRITGQTNEGHQFLRWTDVSGVDIPDELDTGVPIPHTIQDSNQHDICNAPSSVIDIVNAELADVTMELRWTSIANGVAIYGNSRVLIVPLLPSSAGGIAAILNSQEALDMKSQFIASENLQIIFPPFLDTANQVYITASDVVTLTVVKPDGSLFTPAPTPARDPNSDFWVAEIASTNFVAGEWQIKAVSNGADALPQYKSVFWGDYMDNIHQATFGRWKIVGTQLLMYAEDGATVIRTYNLKDSAGNPSASQIWERDPV